MDKEGPEAWPRWPPAYENPLSLVDIRIRLNADKVFQLLYAPGSEYVVSTPGYETVQYASQYPWC
jgi:hypothetical protein